MKIHFHEYDANRAFTLIEVLVVVSIIAVISSIAFMRIEGARARSRDSVREQQIRQIDLATRLYMEEKGHPPYMTGCQAQQTYTTTNTGKPSEAEASACFAVSTAAVDSYGMNPWKQFKDDISAYIAGDGIDDSLGYVYASPLALQYACYASSPDDSCGYGADYFNQNYALYSQFETNDNSTGNISSDDSNNLCGIFGGCEGDSVTGGESNNDQNGGEEDVDAPILSDLFVSNISSEGVTISWTTNEPATSRLDYGTSTYYSGYVYNPSMVQNHVISISGLDSGTQYNFEVSSSDASQNNSLDQGTFSTIASNMPPTADVSYDKTDLTSSPVTATLINPSEHITITNNNGLDTYVFNRNGSFTFEFVDDQGNTGSTTASVSNLVVWFGFASYMDWTAANNLCISAGKRLPTLQELIAGLSYHPNDGVFLSAYGPTFEQGIYYWTKDVSGAGKYAGAKVTYGPAPDYTRNVSVTSTGYSNLLDLKCVY